MEAQMAEKRAVQKPGEGYGLHASMLQEKEITAMCAKQETGLCDLPSPTRSVVAPMWDDNDSAEFYNQLQGNAGPIWTHVLVPIETESYL